MKIKLSKNLAGGAVAAIVFLAGGTGLVVNAQDQPPASPPDNSTPDDSAALPSGVDPSSPLAQVIRLTQSGVSEDVIMAYVTNSTSTFNLDPDKIIYLKDIGAPNDLVTAMMQHDQVLQAQMAAPAYQQPPPQPAPITEPVATGPAPADTTDVAPPPADVTVNYFYSSLAPYGAWVNVDGYGRCWRPTVVIYNSGWQPYCDHGHWVYTDCGWYWISDYTWGWAPFHYGRWFHHARYGWCWTPDTVWGPSWVTWRYSGSYCGWAPLPPFTAYVSGIGFIYRGAAVSVDFNFGLGASLFTFVPTGNFCDPHPSRYRVASWQSTQIYNQTTVINNFNVDSHSRTFINGGIAPEKITAVTRTEIHPVTIREMTTPVARGEQLGRDGRTLMVNRPHFTDNPSPSMNRSESSPRPSSPPPAAGSPYQPSHYGTGNNNPPPSHTYQLEPAGSENGRPGQPARNGEQNNYNSQPPRTGQPAQTMPSPGTRYAPVAPVQQSAPNYNSPDNRRYPSPHMQQNEQQNSRANSSGSGGRAVAPVEQSAPAQTAPAESRPNYSQPNAAGSQSYNAPSPAPAQPQRSGGNGGSRNQNGQR